MTKDRFWRSALLFMMMLLGVGGLIPAGAQDASTWYPFQPAEDTGPSVIGMENWLDAPAGKHGPVRMEGDGFLFEDGTPVKFWGVNLGNADCAPARELGEQWAAMKAKYGVNCVRLHKFIGPGRNGIGDPQDSTKYTPEGLDQLDYFCAQLKKRGIYYGWSWIFEHSVRPADRDKLLAYDEIVAAGGTTQRVALFIAEDVQNLRMEMLKELLQHRNPHTGLTYAEDPALTFIEFQNEDSIFFYSFGGFRELDKLPTYKKLFIERFSDFLKAKYGSHAGLVEAWGEKALNTFEIKDEHLDKRNIMVQGNPWFFSPAGLDQAKGLGTTQRLLDTAAFLFEAQSKYYQRFRDVIREAGYKGPLVGSCWGTPPGLPMYYNLLNDYEVGFIDRHGYFGKGTHNYRPQPGTFGNDSQLDNPGTGLLSKGLLQVADRPFALSEWTSVFPNVWNLESPAIIAAYGLGLQGWDASYDFASHIREYNGRLFAKNLNDRRLRVVDTPNQIGLYPALARMVYRGDVKQGEVISRRAIDPEQLRKGQPGWIHEESTSEGWDFLEYQGKVPAAAMAAGRVIVDFVDAPEESLFPDMAKFVEGNTILSNTKQLAWTRATDGQRGYFTINTDGSKAVVGHLPKAPVILDNVTIESANPFAMIMLTSLEKDLSLKDSKRWLLLVMARVQNTGMVIEGEELKKLGTGPMLIEPVEARITVANRKVSTVRLLDHDGRATDKTLPVAEPGNTPAGEIVSDGSASSFAINGEKDATFYYEITLE